MFSKIVYAQDIEKINVVVTIAPLAYFVEEIGKDRVDVSVMVPSGADPHSYEPSVSQMKKIDKADIYVKIGTAIDFEIDWLDKLFDLNKNMRNCDSSLGINADDPHIWLSVEYAKIISKNIKDTLVGFDPDNKDFYEKNTLDLIQRLDDLKKEINLKLSGLKNRSFLVIHPAWEYFAQDFNLKQFVVEYEGKEPGPKAMAEIINNAKQNNIKVVFVSPQFSKKSAQVIASEIGGRVEEIDPLAYDYIENLRKAADLIQLKIKN